MTMKKGASWSVAALLSLLIGSSSYASGGMEGGGGKSVICRNPDGTIRSAEILDLYEGRVVYQLAYQESPRDWKSQVIDFLNEAGVGTAQSTPASTIYDWYLNAINHLTFLPDGTSLKPVDDSLEVIIPDGCTLEQTVNYQNDHLILVQESLWRALSETQKAALIIHEATYRLLRGTGETDSRRARHFTAHVVSGHKIEDIFPGNGYQLICEGGGPGKETAFYAVLQPKPLNGDPQQVRLQFWRFGGRRMMSRTFVDVSLLVNAGPGAPPINVLDQLKNPQGPNGLTIEGITLQSLFEPGDTFNLAFWSAADQKWEVELFDGISAVNGSSIGHTVVKCDAI